jgi:hypothetical protein
LKDSHRKSDVSVAVIVMISAWSLAGFLLDRRKAILHNNMNILIPTIVLPLLYIHCLDLYIRSSALLNLRSTAISQKHAHFLTASQESLCPSLPLNTP